MSIGALRQQIKTTHRVHGIITNGGLAPNIIPDHTSMRYYVRAPTKREVDDLRERVAACFEYVALLIPASRQSTESNPLALRAAALATGCTFKVEAEVIIPVAPR